MKEIKILFLIVSLTFTYALIFPCTGINVSKDGITIFGNNEDYYTRFIYDLRFLPAANGKYGRVSWGHANSKWAQGGMNDKGLCWDGFGTPDANIIFSPDKLHYNGDLTDKIMEECVDIK